MTRVKPKKPLQETVASGARHKCCAICENRIANPCKIQRVQPKRERGAMPTRTLEQKQNQRLSKNDIIGRNAKFLSCREAKHWSIKIDETLSQSFIMAKITHRKSHAIRIALSNWAFIDNWWGRKDTTFEWADPSHMKSICNLGANLNFQTNNFTCLMVVLDWIQIII